MSSRIGQLRAALNDVQQSIQSQFPSPNINVQGAATGASTGRDRTARRGVDGG